MITATNLTTNTSVEVNDNLITGLSLVEPHDNYFLISHKNEVNSFSKIFNDVSTLVDSDNVDENNRYSCYNDYDFLSVKIFKKDLTLVEINAFICSNFILMVLPDKEIPEITDIITALNQRIQKLFTKKQNSHMLSKILYFLLDIIVNNYVVLLENIEDEGEEIKKEIISTEKKN
jgi:Mg2+ and Co2+ transporter CorA